ncbi:hypothetical protein ACA30_20800 [Virgibacillus soli]|uniref:Uncharacterized protein n=1 Tax=Lederbergia galactosidilytica TaxID=217031 RepID=A0A0Q9XN54_9BACI|nr:hypothetical protein ACA29_20975 [Lederbergia galactosidilytica]KRG12078.1 hypothetical protein ACA30_20800 [Virgibacillus soli]
MRGLLPAYTFLKKYGYCLIKELNKENSPFRIIAAAKSKINITDIVMRILATGPSIPDTFGTNSNPITANPANILEKYIGILLSRKVILIPPYSKLRLKGYLGVGVKNAFAKIGAYTNYIE